MADGSGGGAGGLDPRKLSLCYSKLFQKQQAFAAEQAHIFSKLAAGDVATMEAVLKLPDTPVGGGRNGAGEEEHANGKKRKMKRDPDAPKRPKSGYQLYVCEQTPGLRKAQPEAKMTDIMSVLATDWKKLTEDEKEKYQKMASTEKTLYQEQLATYKANQGGGGGGGSAAAASPAKAKAAAASPGAAAEAASKAKDTEEEDEEQDDTESEPEVKKHKSKKKKKHKKHHREES